MVALDARTDAGRSRLALPVAVVSVAAVVAAPTLTPHPGVDRPAQLAAAALPVEMAADLTDVALPATFSISDAIIGAYLTVEKWVQYGVDLLSWALRWLPFGGLLAAQLNIFYDFGESIVSSVVFNTAYLLDGTVGFGEALSNIGSATATAFSTLIDDQLAWVRGLFPPLPPLAAEIPDAATVFDIGGFTDPGALTGLLPDLAEIVAGATP